MGQYFRLIAPHRRERLSWWGKLGEILFDGSGSALVYHFARPVIPSTFTGDEPRNIPAAVRGSVVPQKRRRQSSHSQKLPRHEVARSRLHELPVEINRIIFDFLDITDVFILGLTCEKFWAIAKSIIGQRFAACLGGWAGTAVICVGDESDCGRNVAYPEGLLLPEDFDELQEGLDLDELEDGVPDKYAGQPVNLYSIADARYDIVGNCDVYFPQDLLHVALEHRHKHPRPADILEVAHPRGSTFYPASHEWVLRNLTTREFVRPMAVALNKRRTRGPFIDTPGYGEVILSRTCWSTEDNTSMARKGMHQGVWAGHALDIVPSTYLDSGGPWKDISDDVAKNTAEIWKSEYGED
ncbi:hypothetical protein MGYG_01661 [Nannizzia gypsea CBS 118893]|uniref:F-box domain-containing protein n=1 Tax=Arthroderma gypseum (strain ATCC MYA-4604 / CBS 118893) TaxID=535722 RepID=E5R275_ARTGP|nr:hypothetical protein MGYG_01661 [Nannizzia gypsea CBS 118893]EFQ98639.1 hypothetical protein MGYG_01661 [Nannizzia gypsea CBS 118893]